MVKANPSNEFQDYANKIPQYLKENSDVVVVEKFKPIVLEEQLGGGMFGEEKISYGLSEPLETPFNDTVLYVAPKNSILDMKKLLDFRQEVLNYEFPDFSGIEDAQVGNKTICFPKSFYSEVKGTLSRVCSKYNFVLKDKLGTELYSTSLEENQEFFTTDADIKTSVLVLFFPNVEIANAVYDKKLKH